MANIPLRDVPNLPRYDPSMPMPEGRVPDLPQLRGIPGQLDNPFQFTRNTEGLMQEFRDPKAAAMISRAGEKIADSMTNFGGSLMKLGSALDKAKQLADISRVENDAALTWTTFNEKANMEGLLPEERYRRWTEDWGPGLYDRATGMGLSPYSQSEALPKLNQFIQRKASDLSNNVFQYQTQQHTTAIITGIENSLAVGDKLGAEEGNERLTRAGLQTKEEEIKRGREINQKYGAYQMQVQMNKDPRVVLEEMKEAQIFGSSDIYPEVTDPKMIADYRNAAQGAVNAIYVDTQNDIDNRISAGEITNMEQVRSLANGKLEPRHMDQFEKKLTLDPVHNPQAVEEIRTRIKKHNAVTDGELTEYDSIHDDIVTRVPRHIQEILGNELKAQQAATREGKLKPAQEKFIGEIWDVADDLAKNGYFNAGQTGRDPKNQNKITDWPTHLTNWEKTGDAKDKLAQFIRENPLATRKEAKEKIKEIGGDTADDWATQQRLQRFEEAEERRRQDVEAGTKEAFWGQPIPGDINLRERNELIPTGPLEPKPFPQRKEAQAPEASKPTSMMSNPKLKGVVPELLTRLDVLQQKFGALKINSGYRSPSHNARVGGAGDSEHTRGDAVDIDVRGMSKAERLALIEAASQAGILGIGVYENSLHFDLGQKYGRRAWGPSYGRGSVPAWAKAVINRHVGA